MDSYSPSAQQLRREQLSSESGGPDLATDDLTGFLTQRSLRRFLKSPEYCPPELSVTLLAVELNHFELIEIGAGLERSEQFIARLGQRLVRLFPHALAFARLADARIGVLIASEDQLESRITRLIDFLQRSVAVAGQIIMADIRIGIASRRALPSIGPDWSRRSLRRCAMPRPTTSASAIISPPCCPTPAGRRPLRMIYGLP